MTKKTEAKDPTALSEKEIAAARKDGAIEAQVEAGKTAETLKTGTESDVQVVDRWPDRHEIMQYADLIDLGVEAFEDAVSEKPKDGAPVPEGKVAGLLELERSGKNRTPYVKALMKRLGVKSPYEVTSAGPDYTNDVQPVSKL